MIFFKTFAEKQTERKGRDYDRDVRALDDEILKLDIEITRLRAALEWYANEDNYAHWGAGGCDFGSDIENDHGERARKALAEEEK